MSELYEFFYTSELAPQVMPTAVSDIVRVARANNPRLDITGLLVFDGWRFYQYLEGSETAVKGLASKIADDERHINFTVKHEGNFPGPRRFDKWGMAYALMEDQDEMERLEQLRGPSARDLLITLLPQLDLGADARGQ